MKQIMLGRFLRSKLRLQQLNMLLLLDRYGNIHRVAEIMGLTQPAVTKSLKDLEALVEAPLFVRESRGLRVTPICKPLLRAARESILSLNSALTTMRDMQSGDAGHMSIGTVGSQALRVVAEAVCRTQRERPALTVKLDTQEQVAQLSELIEGRLDLVVTAMPAQLPEHSGLVATPLRIEPQKLCVAVCMPPSPSTAPITFGDALANFVWIFPPYRDPLRQHIDAAVVALGLQPPRRIVEAVQPELMMLHPISESVAAIIDLSVAQLFAAQGAVRILDDAPAIAPMPSLVVLMRTQPELKPELRIVVENLMKLSSG